MALKKSVRISILIAAIVPMALVFQNCSKTSFEQVPETSDVASGAQSMSATDPGQQTGQNGQNGQNGQSGVLIDPDNGNVNSVGGNVVNPIDVGGNQFVCPGNSHAVGNSCVQCQGSEIFDSGSGSCRTVCAAGANYNASTNSCVTCGASEAWSGQSCVPLTAECNSFEEIKQTTNNAFVIPARSLDKICYYMKIYDEVPQGPSVYTGPRRADIRSRDHNTGSSETTYSNPLILGDKSVNVYMMSGREVSLASNISGTGNLLVDNYILIDVAVGLQHALWGAGTADSMYRDGTGAMAVRTYNSSSQSWQPISFTSLAPSGTASITPVSLTSQIPQNTVATVRVSELDCGGSRYTTAGYLIFK